MDKGLWPLLIVWATASAVFAFFAFDFLKEIPVVGPAFLAAEPSALQSLVFVAMIIPIVGIECLRIALLSVWFWLWKIWKSETGLNYGMIWFRKLAKTESAKVQAQRRSWPVNQPDRGLKFFGQVGYLAWALTLLLLVPIAVIASVGGIRSLVISARQDLPMFFAAMAVVALIFIAAALFDLTRLMNVKRLPRAVLSIGTVVLVFSLILKIPVWVYLEGLGVPQLADDVEWTGSVSLAMPLLVAGLVVGALVALCVLVTSRSGFPSGFMVLTICVLAMTALVSILGSIQQSGRGLLADGTANHAQGSFPGAACIGLVQETSMKPVWVISIKNSLLTTVPRSPTGEPNDVAGSVSQHPLKDYRIVYVSSTPEANTATRACGSG
ncbi:hypothetical protein [Arthrobacter sp. Y81]|uniref:hypothetical protein n=1 Tax=Arthrobacter sp. Y81 TaxID=2058897 RepID=UPI000CE4EAE8|nr:hypothetical protein [Arthrobacter sp. Y81]